MAMSPAPIGLNQQDEAAAWNELRPVLHDEVDRLPDKYRLPVILCYLEGKTNEEVARELRWPVGTVKGRLSWGSRHAAFSPGAPRAGTFGRVLADSTFAGPSFCGDRAGGTRDDHGVSCRPVRPSLGAGLAVYSGEPQTPYERDLPPGVARLSKSGQCLRIRGGFRIGS